MGKFKELTKSKKIAVCTGGAVVIVGLGLLVGSFMGKAGAKDVTINKDTLAGLIPTKYTVETVAQTPTDLNVTIKGNLNQSDLESFSKKLDEKADLSKWGKTHINVDVFSNDAQSTKFEGANTKDFIAKVNIDEEKNTAKINEFETLPATDKAKDLVTFEKGSITSKDGVVTVETNAELQNGDTEEVTLTNALAQAKGFTELFRDTNKGKNITNVELKINPNKDTSYTYNDGAENTLEVGTLVHL